ncbi:DUF5082 domain-containing protein [Listeria welshimeri]|nr:DUF5082 domain-containing protein [Listeria welshimeri]MBC1770694.1 DUF5082 domain-containing protein [Listeria welshimeri]
MSKENLLEQKNKKTQELSQKKSELGDIEKDIEDLKIIKENLEKVKEEAKESKKNTEALIIENHDRWKGVLKDKWEIQTETDLINEGIKEYIDKVDRNLDEINLKIMELENKKYNTEGVIGNLRSGLNWLGTQIENFIN